MNDCIIIGGGLIGMLTACALRRRGYQVTVIERGPFGREASWAGGGILSPLYPWRYADAVNRLAMAGQALYPGLARELIQATGIDPEWRRCGLLVLDAAEAEAATGWAGRWQVELHVLTAGDLERQESGLAARHGPALAMPAVAQIRNPRLIKAMQAYLRQNGVRMLADDEVVAIEARQDRITGVKTAGGEFHPGGNVIIANGAWSGKLLRQTRIDLHIRPIRGQMILLQTEPGVVRHIVLDGGHYLIPRADGQIVVGSTIEDTGFDAATTDQALAELQTFAAALVPALARAPVVAHWAGLRPGCGQGIPYIGPHPEIEGLYVNAGHYRNGIVMAPAAAELLADLITGRKPAIDPAPYALTEKRELKTA
jgi:glycine oxidase